MQSVFEGTWEEIKQHEAEFKGKHLRVIIHSAPPPQMTKQPTTARVSAMGKYAGTLNTEEFLERKREETEREDRAIL